MRRGEALTMETQTTTAPAVLIHCPTCLRALACTCEAEAVPTVERHILAAHLRVQ